MQHFLTFLKSFLFEEIDYLESHQLENTFSRDYHKIRSSKC